MMFKAPILVLGRLNSGTINIVKSFIGGSGVLLCANLVSKAPIGTTRSNFTEAKKIKSHDVTDASLSHRKLVENASSLAVESVCTLHYQTALALMDSHVEYAQAVSDLTDVLELSLILHPDAPISQDELWENIIACRHDVNETKHLKMENERLFDDVEKLVGLAAEISFSTGAEYSAVSANERLVSVKTRMSSLSKVTIDAEQRLHLTEAKVIAKTGKKSETVKNKKLAREE